MKLFEIVRKYLETNGISIADFMEKYYPKSDNSLCLGMDYLVMEEKHYGNL